MLLVRQFLDIDNGFTKAESNVISPFPLLYNILC